MGNTIIDSEKYYVEPKKIEEVKALANILDYMCDDILSADNQRKDAVFTSLLHLFDLISNL